MVMVMVAFALCEEGAGLPARPAGMPAVRLAHNNGREHRSGQEHLVRRRLGQAYAPSPSPVFAAHTPIFA